MQNLLKWENKKLEDIKALELHNIFKLRSEIFVVEQDCVYLDIDGKDHKAIHIIASMEDKIIAYARIFKSGDYFDTASIGRVAVDMDYRKYGYGHVLIEESIKAINNIFGEKEIKISAQKHLTKFYSKHGFVQVGEEYLEDGIPHVGMIISSEK